MLFLGEEGFVVFLHVMVVVVVIIEGVPESNDVGIAEFDVHLAVEVFFPEVLEGEMGDVCGEEFDLVMVLGLVVCVKEDAIDLESVNDGFGEEEFGEFEVVDEEFIGFVVESEVEVDEFVEREVLETGAAGDKNVGYFGVGDEGAIVFE
jgi:hypothetical protein